MMRFAPDGQDPAPPAWVGQLGGGDPWFYKMQLLRKYFNSSVFIFRP